MSQNRQLAAIMFTDIVGYTALMGKDEKKAFELLRKNREIQKPLIKGYNGTWIKELGDGVLASFHTITDAIFCAAAIHQACSKIDELKLRIGIHLGEVIFEDNDVFGDGVNIASRLQAMASPGTTWVSEAVYKNLVNKKEITSEFIKEEILKNVAEPVKVYEISVKEIPGFLPDNIKVYQNKDTTEKPVNKKAAYLISGILILVLAAAYFLFFNKKAKPGDDTNTQKSIAVLYFQNMTGDKEQEYFTDGLTEEITSRLAKIKGLSVRGRTSVLPYKGKAENIKKIAEELKVTTILEGSVRQSGNTVRITAQLIDSKTDTQLWSQDFTRELKDIFQLQSDIAHAIAKKLEIEVSDDASKKIDKATTKNIEAYDHYLKAKHIAFTRYYYSGDSVAFELSRQTYEKSIELDPDFALAYAGLADLYDAKRLNGDNSNRTDSLRQSLSLKAYQLDSNSAFVNNVRIWMMVNRKEPLLDNAFYFAAKALRLEPEDYYNWQSIAGLFTIGGYRLQLYQFAVPFYEKATELNPLDMTSFACMGYCYYMMGEQTKSDQAFQTAYELTKGDQYIGIWWVLGWLIRTKQLKEAEQLLTKLNYPEISWPRIAIMFGRGQTNEAQKLIPKLRDVGERAFLYAYANDKKNAIIELNKWPEKINSYLTLTNEPFKKFYGDPEFEKILAKQKALHDDYTKRYEKYVEEFIK